MPTETEIETVTSLPTPVPTRVRRLLDVALLERAYGRGAHDRVPVEIVDLDDGSLVCEWSCERDDEVVGRRVRYASESDMWRELHELARAKGVPRTIPFHAARAWASASTGETTTSFTPAELELRARADAARDFHAEDKAPGLDVVDGARAAWIDRDVGLLALLSDDDALALPSHLPRWVPVAGEDDGRTLDSLGRRNGHGGRRPDASRTMRT
jgi:hypothetical protein